MPNNEELFWSMVELEGHPCDCRLWLGEWATSGHGIWIKSNAIQRGKNITYEGAYKTACRYSGMELPVGRSNHLGHICGLSPCCNPHHLRVISASQNHTEKWIHKKLFDSISNQIRSEIRSAGMDFKEAARTFDLPGVVTFRIIHGNVWRGNYPAPLMSVYGPKSPVTHRGSPPVEKPKINIGRLAI